MREEENSEFWENKPDTNCWGRLEIALCPDNQFRPTGGCGSWRLSTAAVTGFERANYTCSGLDRVDDDAMSGPPIDFPAGSHSGIAVTPVFPPCNCSPEAAGKGKNLNMPSESTSWLALSSRPNDLHSIRPLKLRELR